MESNRTRVSPPRRPSAGANVSHTVPSPPPHKSSLAAARTTDSPPSPERNISLRSVNEPGENVCFMDTVLMCVFWGTVSGQRLLDNISKAAAPEWARLVEFGYGRLDRERLKAHKDASEFALWLLRALENAQIMQRLT